MFRQVHVPILGVIENMSYYLCPHCGEREDIFDHGGVKKTGLEVLGEIPLVEEIRTGGDAGKPIVMQQSEHPVARVFQTLATRVMQLCDAPPP
jgi:ATP-binding protein involved in chromosome partitioning